MEKLRAEYFVSYLAEFVVIVFGRCATKYSHATCHINVGKCLNRSKQSKLPASRIVVVH